MRRALVLPILLFAVASFAQTSTPTVAQVVAKWREAVHASAAKQSQTAVVTSSSNEDGIPGNIEEWVTNYGPYRREVKRQFDEAETVASGTWIAKRRDWNGWVRQIRGKELERLSTQAFDQQLLIFGPLRDSKASLISPGNGSEYALQISNPGYLVMVRGICTEGQKDCKLSEGYEGAGESTWYLDAKTYLPIRSERPGDDSVITTTYSDWREIGGRFVPTHVHVAETEKPDFDVEVKSVKLVPARSLHFDMPKPEPSDVHMDAVVPPIPITMESAHIVFKVSVNGRPPIPFILDTGADQEVLNTTRLADFGLKPYAKSMTTGGGGSAEYDYVEGVTLSLPGVELRNQHVAAIDETGLERALGVPFGGLLGYDFISRFVVEIDYQKLLITLHDPKTWRYAGSGYVVPLTFDDGIPFMNGTISVPTKPDIPAYLVMDFGAQETMTLTSPFVKANNLAELAGTNKNVNGPALSKQFFSQSNIRGRVDKLKLGEMEVDSIPINMSVNTEGAYASKNFAGTVGESIFKRYHVYLDYQRNRAIFEPTEEASQPFPERMSFGMTLLASGADLHTYTVAGVRPGSPADRAGFKKGDVVAGMDGKAATQFTLGELRETLLRAGEHHVFQVRRGDENLSIPVDVKVISLDRQ